MPYSGLLDAIRQLRDPMALRQELEMMQPRTLQDYQRQQVLPQMISDADYLRDMRAALSPRRPTPPQPLPKLPELQGPYEVPQNLRPVPLLPIQTIPSRHMPTPQKARYPNNQQSSLLQQLERFQRYA